MTSPALSEPTKALLARRLLITLAALIAYRLGRQWPLFSISPEAVRFVLDNGQTGLIYSQLAFDALSRFSLLALGLMPLLTSALIGEALILALPLLRRWLNMSAGNRQFFSRLVVGGAIVLALVQVGAIAVALTESDWLTRFPDVDAKIGLAASLLGGFAISLVLVHWIDRHGIGQGMWLLLASDLILLSPSIVVQIAGMVGNGMLPAYLPWLFFAIAALAIWATVSVELASGKNAHETGLGTLNFGGPWPLLIALIALMVASVVVLSALRFMEISPQGPMLLRVFAVTSLVLGPLLIWLVCTIYAARAADQEKPLPTARHLALRGIFPAVAQSLFFFVTAMLAMFSGFANYLAGFGVAVIVILMTKLIRMVRQAGAA